MLFLGGWSLLSCREKNSSSSANAFLSNSNFFFTPDKLLQLYLQDCCVDETTQNVSDSYLCLIKTLVQARKSRGKEHRPFSGKKKHRGEDGVIQIKAGCDRKEKMGQV